MLESNKIQVIQENYLKVDKNPKTFTPHPPKPPLTHRNLCTTNLQKFSTYPPITPPKPPRTPPKLSLKPSLKPHFNPPKPLPFKPIIS